MLTHVNVQLYIHVFLRTINNFQILITPKNSTYLVIATGMLHDWTNMGVLGILSRTET